jgi:hypothetical protein
MRLIRFDSMRDIHVKLTKASEAALPADEQRGAFIPGDDPVELRPVRRLSFTERSHVAIGIKGGQGRSGAEIEAATLPLVISVLACAGILVAALVR